MIHQVLFELYAQVFMVEYPTFPIKSSKKQQRSEIFASHVLMTYSL